MKTLALLPLAALLTACADSGSTQVVYAEGINMSGTYTLSRVQCYNSSLTVNTNNANYSAGLQSTVTVSGNSMTVVGTQGSCRVEQTGRVVFTTENLVTVTSRVVTSATNGECQIDSSLDNTNISPSNRTTVYKTGEALQSFSDVVYIYEASSKKLGLLTTYTDSSNGYCFEVYDKQ